MDMDTIISKWFSTREQQITWSVCLVFLIIFPLYFANMASFLPGGATVVSGDSSGSWSVTFTENEEDGEETIEDMEHEDTYELEFSFDDMAPNLAYIEVIVEHTESGEQGPAPGPFGNIEPWQEQCDTVDVELDMDDVNGWIEDGSTTSSSSMGPPTLRAGNPTRRTRTAATASWDPAAPRWTSGKPTRSPALTLCTHASLAP